MRMSEYVREVYPIANKIKAIMNNPVKLVMEADDLPFDRIAVVDGKLQKIVELDDDGAFITVMELISYEPWEIEACTNQELKEVYNVYMSQIVDVDVDVRQLREVSRRYLKDSARKEELLKHVHDSSKAD